MAEMLEQQLSEDFRLESARYVETDKDAMPITKAAAPKAGQFPSDVAESLAEVLTRLSNLGQQNQIIREMHKDKVLSDEKLIERRAAVRPFAVELIQAGFRLEEAVNRHYGQYRKTR